MIRIAAISNRWRVELEIASDLGISFFNSREKISFSNSRSISQTGGWLMCLERGVDDSKYSAFPPQSPWNRQPLPAYLEIQLRHVLQMTTMEAKKKYTLLPSSKEAHFNECIMM